MCSLFIPRAATDHLLLQQGNKLLLPIEQKVDYDPTLGS
jgi:hypothetical protein